MHLFNSLCFLIFALLISIEDLRNFRISNRVLFLYFFILFLDSLFTGEFTRHVFSGIFFLLLFSVLHLVGRFVSHEHTIGIGDIKLIGVLTFGYVHIGFRSVEIFFISLWLALLAQISLEFIRKRKFVSRFAMAPSIFLAVALYLYAPLGLLLPQ